MSRSKMCLMIQRAFSNQEIWSITKSWANKSSAESDVYSKREKKDQVYKTTVFPSASTVVPDGQKGNNTESLSSDSTPERDEQGFLVTENGGHSFLPSPPPPPPLPIPHSTRLTLRHWHIHARGPVRSVEITVQNISQNTTMARRTFPSQSQKQRSNGEWRHRKIQQHEGKHSSALFFLSPLMFSILVFFLYERSCHWIIRCYFEGRGKTDCETTVKFRQACSLYVK